MSTQVTSQDFYNLIKPLVKEVGKFQKSYLSKDLEIEFKGDINLVTQVDKKSEQMIIIAIQAKYPDHDILAEEGGGGRKDSKYKWIIDPLDGTTNFTHRYPLFAISIALEHDGQVMAGVVYDPNHDELFCGYKGHGAFLNDKKIQVSKINTLNHAMVATGFAYNIRQTSNNNLDHFTNVLMHAQAVRRDGVAAIDVCYVACGRYDAFWELNLFPWDTAAGMIILTEAGGKVSKFEGNAYTVYEKDILVSNGLIHAEMLEMLK